MWKIIVFFASLVIVALAYVTYVVVTDPRTPEEVKISGDVAEANKFVGGLKYVRDGRCKGFVFVVDQRNSNSFDIVDEKNVPPELVIVSTIK